MKNKIQKLCNRKRLRTKEEQNNTSVKIIKNKPGNSPKDFYTSITLSDEDSTDQEKAKLPKQKISEIIYTEVKFNNRQKSKQKIKQKTIKKSRKKSNQLANSEERYVSEENILDFNNSFYFEESNELSKSKKENNDNNEFYPYKIGEIIKKNYEITEFIADGTFGRVLKCIDIENGKIRAIKIIVPTAIDSGIMEAEILYNIKKNDKENISHCIQIYDSFPIKKNNQNYFAIVYEYLGLSVFDFMKKNNYNGYSISQIQQIAKQMLETLKFLHSINYIHTDIKPENIVFINSNFEYIYDESKFPINVKTKIEKEENIYNNKLQYIYHNIKDTKIKTIDFGATLEFQELQNSVGLINTRQYRAPEVIFDMNNSDEKTDIWGTACVLYELYTGEYLFDSENDDEEHLCLIEKVCGHFPDKFIKNGRNKDILHLFFECNIHDKDYNINVKKCKNYEDVRYKIEKQLKLDEAIHWKHKLFIDFLKYLLVIDPYYRPSAAKALNHDFFQFNFDDY